MITNDGSSVTRAWALLVITLGALAGGLIAKAVFPPSWTPQAHEVPVRPKEGTELLVVFVGSSTCGAIEYPGLVDAVAAVRSELEADARAAGKTMVFVGVALDQDPTTGLEFLETFGPFDEILAGGNWVNTGAIEFIVRGFPGRRSMPQLVLVERRIELEYTNVSSVEDRLVGRKVGSAAIVEFGRWLQERPSG